MIIELLGIDGSGKTTVGHLLTDVLIDHGFSVRLISSDTTDPEDIYSKIKFIGKKYDSISEKTELFLYLSWLSERTNNLVIPSKFESDFVVIDRFYYSSLVLSHHGRGIDRDFVKSSLHIACNGLRPDLIILCDTNEFVADNRLRSRNTELSRIENEGIELATRIKKGCFDELSNLMERCLILNTDSSDNNTQLSSTISKWILKQVP